MKNVLAKAKNLIIIIFEAIKNFILNCIRVLRITKKPDKFEFASVVKVSSIGIAILGFIGFLVFLIKEILF